MNKSITNVIKRKGGLVRIATLLLASVMVVNGSCMIVGASELNEYTQYENEIRTIMEEKRHFYLEDPEVYREASDKGLAFEELLREKAISTYENRISAGIGGGISTRDLGNNGNNLSTNIPLIQQTTSKNCGPTSAFQVLYGMNCQNLVSGTTDAEKIEQLMDDCDTDSTGTMVYKLTAGLNMYAARDYEYILGTNMTEAEFQGKVETSLYYNTAPIIHARTEYLPYYNGHASGHYIAICEVDKANKKIRVKDCNNNNAYYGVHQESISDVYKTISEVSSRYLICMEY